MGLHRAIIFLIAVCTGASFADNFVTLDCEDVVTGILNEDTKLTCCFQSVENKYDLIQLTKMEDSENKVPLFNSVNNKVSQSRIKLVHPDSNDVSLLIQKTQLTDEGTYRYYLGTTSGFTDKEIVLKVKAPYSSPKVTLHSNTTSTVNLSCETTGYPQAQIHWFVNGNLTSESKNSCNKTPAGLVTITSILQINKGQITSEDNYTCAVWNIDKNVYEIWEQLGYFNLPQPVKTEKSNLVAVFVIIGVGFLALAVLVILQLQKRNQPAVRSAYRMSMISSDQRTDV